MSSGAAWRACCVADIAETASGPFGSNLVSADYVDDGVPVIRGQNLGYGRWIGGEYAYVTPEKTDSLSNNQAIPGDLVFTQRGTLGQVALVPRDPFDRYVLSQSQMRLRAHKGVADSVFLYYAFRSPKQQEYIRSHAIQTGVPHTNLGILRNTPLLLPPLEEQLRIAWVLAAFDDKVEHNNVLAACLDEFAEAVFRRDINPNGAQAGELPKGWTWTTVSDMAAINEASHTDKNHPAEVEYIDISNTSERRIEATSHLSWDDAPSRARRIVRAGDTLISTVRPERKSMVFVPESRNGLTASTGFAVISPKDVPASFLYRAVTARESIERLALLATGAAYPAVNPKVIGEWRVPMPPDRGAAFDSLVGPVELLRWRLLEESKILADARDEILPSLVSGEVHLTEVCDGLDVPRDLQPEMDDRAA